MSFKKLILIILLIAIISCLVVAIVFNNGKKEKSLSSDTNKLKVVVTSFSAYDFVKNIAGDKIELTYLLGPGMDAHSYDPTAADLITIQQSDIFIYIGGEMESWTEKVLPTLDISNTKVICMARDIETIEEQEIDGAEKEEEEEVEGAFDEHIWTSPDNAMTMVQSLSDELSNIDEQNKKIYQENASKYITEIKEVQTEIQQIVDNRVRDRLVFGDKMPIQYFLNEFGLTASAAFSGCSTETEPSSGTIAYLIKKVKEENIPVVLYIELNNGKVAQTIANESNAQAIQIQSLHNISKDDFDNGETYISLMTRNLEVLKKALQ